MEFKRQKKLKKPLTQISQTLHTSKETPRDISNTQSSLGKFESSKPISESQSFQKAHLHFLIKSILSLNEDENLLTKIKNNYEDNFPFDKGSKRPCHMENPFKRKKNFGKGIPKSKSLSDGKYQNELGELKEFYKRELEHYKTKMKIDFDMEINPFKVKLAMQKEEEEENNKFIEGNTEEEFNYYLEQLNGLKGMVMERNESEELLKRGEENIKKIIEMKKYLLKNYYGDFINKKG